LGGTVMLRDVVAAVLLCLSFAASAAHAQEVRLTEDRAEAVITINGQQITIGRIQDQANQITGEFARTSRPCPPFCIHPMSAGEGVATLGELEVIAFLETKVATGEGILIDSRLPVFFQAGTIPGAVNVPFSILEAENPYRNDIMRALGATGTPDAFDFSGALDLLLFCNGPWCDQSPRAIRNLLAAGYPAAKISYYRGGMQDWLLMGLSVQTPAAEG